MLDWLFILLLIAAILLILMAIEFRDELFWGSTFTLLDIFLWFLLAASVLEIEVPYQAFNTTSGAIETGTHIVTSKVAPEMVYLFDGIGAIMLIYFIGYVMFPIVLNVIYKRKLKW